MTRDDQLEILTAELMQDYAAGKIAWRQIRQRNGVTDYDLILVRLGEEGLKLPKADPRYSQVGIERLRAAMQQNGVIPAPSSE